MCVCSGAYSFTNTHTRHIHARMPSTYYKSNMMMMIKKKEEKNIHWKKIHERNRWKWIIFYQEKKIANIEPVLDDLVIFSFHHDVWWWFCYSTKKRISKKKRRPKWITRTRTMKQNLQKKSEEKKMNTEWNGILGKNIIPYYRW